jgi:transcriptional regulator with XRE-family HTH domain
MLTLALLRSTRLSRRLSREHISLATGIHGDRIRLLELNIAEPWFDEAILLSRVLGVDGILPLVVLGTLADCDCGEPTENDLAAWRGGLRSPLSLACRVAARYGLTDPAALSVSALERQIWDVLQATERHPEAPGWCAWCRADIVAGEAHGALCLPANLWTPHDLAEGEALPEIVPTVRVKRSRGKGLPAKGLKALRVARELRQTDVADHLTMHANYYARVERGEVPLSPENADKLIDYYGVEREVLYMEPVDG